MPGTSELNFVFQQGFRSASAAECGLRYPALMWQPRVLGVLVLACITLQAWPLFLALAVILWWNALLPQWNPFDTVYNRFVASSKDPPPLPPAPAPRRFAQGMAAAYVLQALLVVALAALTFGRFCLGSYVYHLLSGNSRFANRTLPWVRSG